MKVHLLAYDPEWKDKFNFEANTIANVLKPGCRIEHIGSTSIKNIKAKPIVDMLIGIPLGHELDSAVPALQSLGYIHIRKYEDVMPFRRFFIKVKNNAGRTALKPSIDTGEKTPRRDHHPRLFHLHLVHTYSKFFRQHLAFRDYMNANPQEARKYEDLKIQLAKKNWKTVNDYAAAKANFIQHVLSSAETK